MGAKGSQKNWTNKERKLLNRKIVANRLHQSQLMVGKVQGWVGIAEIKRKISSNKAIKKLYSQGVKKEDGLGAEKNGLGGVIESLIFMILLKSRVRE